MSLTLTSVSQLTEEEARATFERIRWPNGPVCHRCGCVEVTKLAGEAHRVGLYKCRGCEEQFSSTTGTILEQSHLPIRTWLMAFAILCSSKKGVSALQLQRQLGLGSYRTAWHMAHRIRHAMSQEPLAGLLGAGGGVVEVDETYIGGKPRKGTGEKPRFGRATKKTPVVALVERGGRVRAKKMVRPNKESLHAAIREAVDPSAAIHTDQWPAYRGIGEHFAGGHSTVNHADEEYARDGVHVNSAEGFFALLKRGIHGSFHHISVQHMPRYLTEFSFRWDRRKITDGARTAEAIRGAEGKRLKYRQPIDGEEK
jgi:transposase-like protein